MRPHSNGESRFHLFGENLIFLKKTWSHHLFLFYFFKGKQNKKEISKCDSLFGKDMSVKTESGFGGQVTYWEGTVKTVAPL